MKHSRIRPTQWVAQTLLLITIAFTGIANAQENVGHVIFSYGKITASNDNKLRLLKRGSSIYEGDILKTAAHTSSQLRMSDGALVALRSNTEFSIDKYQYSKNSTISTSIFSLIKGGFRTITGLIGKNNKKNYRVKTSVATIGIRGTHYGLTLCAQGNCGSNDDGVIKDGLYGSVIDGEIVTKNQSGTNVFSNDEYFHIASNTSKPENLLKPPGVVFKQGDVKKHNKKEDAKKEDTKKELSAKLRNRHAQQSDLLQTRIEQKKEFIRSQLAPKFEASRDTNTGATGFPEPTVAGNVLGFTFFEKEATGNLIIVQEKALNDGTGNNQFFLNSIAKENGLFIPIAAKQTDAVTGEVRTLSLGGAKPLEPQSLIIPNTTIAVGWGRWSNQYIVTINDVATPHVGQLHYIVASSITSPAQLGGLTGTANYSTIGGTRATDLTGNIAAGAANVSMGVDFAASSINTFNISTRVGSNTYQANITAPVTISTAVGSGLNLTGLPAGPCPSCTGQASMAFIGPNAEGAGTIYSIGSNAAKNAISGAAILAR